MLLHDETPMDRAGEPNAKAVRIGVKVVPGSRSDAIVGWLGDRLKVKVAAPAEDGKANAAVCRVIAEDLGVRPSRVTLITGASNPEKTLRIEGFSSGELRDRW